MGEYEGHELGAIHVAAAAEPENRIRAEGLRLRGRVPNDLDGRLRLIDMEAFQRDAGGRESGRNLLHDAGLHQNRIRHDEDAFRSEAEC